jgi:galactokinase
MTPAASVPAGRARADAAFRARFHEAPAHLVRAPGRIHLLGGEETPRLMMAIDAGVWLALRPRADRRVALYDEDRADAVEFLADNPEPSAPSWRELVKGVAAALRASGQTVTGWEGCVSSNLPGPADLAAQAGLALVVARAFALCGQQAWDGMAAARLCQQARLAWGGGEFTLYDGLCLTHAEADHALWVEPRTLQTESVRVPPRFACVLVLTGQAADDLTPRWMEREAQGRAAARRLGVLALSDLTLTEFAREASHLDDVMRRRVRHVVTETDRVTRAVQAMKKGDGEGLGILLTMSQASVRDDYELTDLRLDALAQVVRNVTGCVGARVSNGGVLALVAQWALTDFQAKLAPAARQHLGLNPVHALLRPACGVSAE